MNPDVNYKSYVNETGLFIDNWQNPETVSAYDDVMKFSNCTNVTVSGVLVMGGKEDCIDAVRGSNYFFTDLSLVPLWNGVTIKGSIENATFKNISFETTGKDYCIELGQFDNYWTPGRLPTRGVKLENVHSVSGAKVTVRVWDAEMPTVINSPSVVVKKIPKFIWYPYFLFRRWQIKKK